MKPLFGSRDWKPSARTAELLVEELGEELMVYDQRNDQVHCLGLAARRVWRACDGNTSVEQLADTLSMESAVVDQALSELQATALLDGEAENGVTRREATLKLAKVGAAATAAPLIYSIGAPTPALAASQNYCENLTPDTGCAGACTRSAGVILNGVLQQSCNGNVNKQAFCDATCRVSGCACCFSSPGMCNAAGDSNIFHFVRCTASCIGINNICNTAYITMGGAPCNNMGAPGAGGNSTFCGAYSACL